MDNWNANLSFDDGDSIYGLCITLGTNVFWGATVITGLFGAIPFIGDALQTLLLGGPAVDNATLNRFFSLHYLFPFLIAGLVIVHIWAFHTTGITIRQVLKFAEVRRKKLKKTQCLFGPIISSKMCLLCQ